MSEDRGRGRLDAGRRRLLLRRVGEVPVVGLRLGILVGVTLREGHDPEPLRECYSKLPFVVYIIIRLDLLPPFACNTNRLKLHSFLSSLSQANSA